LDDERESHSYRIMELLAQRGAEVAHHDPYVPVVRPTREHPQWTGTMSVPWDRGTIGGFDPWLLRRPTPAGTIRNSLTGRTAL
jgi:UDP-N-acetyl-D-glucosamine dehydrogenase